MLDLQCESIFTYIYSYTYIYVYIEAERNKAVKSCQLFTKFLKAYAVSIKEIVIELTFLCVLLGCLVNQHTAIAA
jgi:hypothetical protein